MHMECHCWVNQWFGSRMVQVKCSDPGLPGFHLQRFLRVNRGESWWRFLGQFDHPRPLRHVMVEWVGLKGHSGHSDYPNTRSRFLQSGQIARYFEESFTARGPSLAVRTVAGFLAGHSEGAWFSVFTRQLAKGSLVKVSGCIHMSLNILCINDYKIL